MSLKNHTVVIQSAKQRPFGIVETEVTKPGKTEVLVKNHAIAVNPIDSAIQNLGVIAQKYPTTLGHDNAGEIVAVGSEVTKFNVGDRVLALCSGTFSSATKYAGFQEYSTAPEHAVTKIPDDWSYAQASVIPLAATTASVGLFNVNGLNLQPPKSPRAAPTGKTLLVWGGASSVGSNVIQLAHAAGYNVAATASSVNFEALKKLGANILVDYHETDAVEQLAGILNETDFVGAYVAAGDDSGIENAAKVVNLANGVKKVISAVVLSPRASPVIHVDWVDIYLNVKPETLKSIEMIFSDYFPQAFASGEYKQFPPARIVGHGIGALQEATDISFLRKIAEKTVIEL